ncbi:MAG: hypothetical protein ACJA0V_003552 [Planctomycetota bacterium]|jgi:hypothetical protein
MLALASATLACHGPATAQGKSPAPLGQGPLAQAPLAQAPLAQGPWAQAPWGQAAINAYLEAAREQTIAACASNNLSLPDDFLAWIDSDATLRASVYGCRKDPLPVLLQLRSLEIELGEDIVRRDYTQLALAFAIQRSYMVTGKKASGWNDGDAEGATVLADITQRPRLQLTIPADPRQRVNTKDEGRTLDREDHIVNFLEDHAPIEVDVTSKERPPLEYDDKGIAKKRGKAVKVTRKVPRALVGADVIASIDLQQEFHSYMLAHGHDIALDCGNQVVHWQSKAAVKDKQLRERIRTAHELFHSAYRNKGRMPAERDRAPTAAESMAWLIRNDRHEFTPKQQVARNWPRFPLNAPWPVLLMLAADDQPLREREEIWIKFRDHGEFRTYGEYIGGIAQQFDMQSARRVSPIAFNYGSIQMMWKDGGVCGTMGNIGARTFRICGVPSSTAGQPGHCALVRMDVNPKTGLFRCIGGQYATGGDEVTSVHARWNYDDVGGRRPMVFHQSIAWGVNQGVASFVDTLIMRRMWETADETTRQTRGCRFVREAVTKNPFALAAVLGAINTASDGKSAAALLDTFQQQFNKFAKPDEYSLYRDQVRDLVHARVLATPAPKTKGAATQLLSALQRQDSQNGRLLARTWRTIGGDAEFHHRTTAAARSYVASNRTKATSKQFGSLIKVWERTLKGKAKRTQWAEKVLAAFTGKEALRTKRRMTLDPVVAQLCKMAGREPPKVGK